MKHYSPLGEKFDFVDVKKAISFNNVDSAKKSFCFLFQLEYNLIFKEFLITFITFFFIQIRNFNISSLWFNLKGKSHIIMSQDN